MAKSENIDGYTLTNKMRRTRRIYPITATEQALYSELVAICNEYDWIEVFSCSNQELCSVLQITEKTLAAARLALVNSGLLFYKSGKSKRQFGEYSFTKNISSTVNITPDKYENTDASTVNIPVDEPFNVQKVGASTVNITPNNAICPPLSTVKFPDYNKTKLKETKEVDINISFEEFWNAYEKKTGSLEKLKKKWAKLNDSEREKIMEHVPLYIKSQPDKAFRKNPETYLNNRSWEDEIIKPQNQVDAPYQPKPSESSGAKPGTSEARITAARNW